MLDTDAHMTNSVARGIPGNAVLVPPGQPEEKEIMANWRMEGKPLVSICCATFNHAGYLRDALSGFLFQKTSFPFEIIIRDDASTDGTTEIVKEYAQRYPNIVRAVIEIENQFKKGVRATHAWPSLAKGEFIALCEGDDFWTSPDKLQRQVELLRKYSAAVMSVALTHVCRQEGNELHYLNTTAAHTDELLGFEEIHKNYYHTSTYLMRSNIFKAVIKEHFDGHALYGDTALRAIMITQGQFAQLAEVVSVYRITGSGLWTSMDRELQLLWEFDVARKLASTLPGVHGEHQRGRLFGLTKCLLRQHMKNFSILKSVKLVPLVFWYGLIKLPRNAMRRP